MLTVCYNKSGSLGFGGESSGFGGCGRAQSSFAASHAHNPQRCELLRTGLTVGAVEDIEYSAGKIELGVGEALFIYSDRVEETKNGMGEFYGGG